MAQYKTLSKSLKDTVPNVARFLETYTMDCPAAMNRLFMSEIPGTVEHKAQSSDMGMGTTVAVAECIQHFITAVDSLKFNMVAVDEVHRPLNDILMALISRVPQLPPDFEGKVKMRDWNSRLKKDDCCR